MVPQAGAEGEIPEVLLRFQRAMNGMGYVAPPSSERTYKWRTRGMAEAHMALVALWPYLGEIKRHQASRALRIVEEQYGEGGLRRG